MTGVLLLYTGAFLLYGVMEVVGLMPQELVSAGLTLPRLFAKYLGDPVSIYYCATNNLGSVCLTEYYGCSSFYRIWTL